jgi:hypothetical protein
MPVLQAFAIMEQELGTGIDPVCFGALREALARADREAA